MPSQLTFNGTLYTWLDRRTLSVTPLFACSCSFDALLFFALACKQQDELSRLTHVSASCLSITHSTHVSVS